jgi:tagatose 1,6-diphosphate aldolase
MAKVQITRGKFNGINACANASGVIAAAAMDQRGSLQKAIGKARDSGSASADDLTQFKTAVTKVLTKHASAILMDPEFGLPALKEKDRDAGVLLAYEKTGYDATVRGRLPDLLDEWSVRRLLQAGADAIKILLYYNPYEGGNVNTIKHAFIERIGAECAANDAPFFLEPVYYDDDLDDLAVAKKKPEAVTAYMAEFSKPQYGVDVLKVEVPFNIKYIEGSKAFGGTAVGTKADALKQFKDAASAATKPFIYLSAGVTDAVFIESLEWAAEAGTPFSGVLCGRATWQEGIPVFAKQGYDALVSWLEDRGVKNVTALNETLAKGAKPWWNAYGGKDNIEVVG